MLRDFFYILFSVVAGFAAAIIMALAVAASGFVITYFVGPAIKVYFMFLRITLHVSLFGSCDLIDGS